MKYEDPQIVNKSDGRTYDPPLDMPNKGTGTGFIPGMGGSYGASTEFAAINRLKGIASSSDSDPMDKECADEQKQQNQPGNRYHEPNGKSITGACESDAWKDETPKDQRY